MPKTPHREVRKRFSKSNSKPSSKVSKSDLVKRQEILAENIHAPSCSSENVTNVFPVLSVGNLLNKLNFMYEVTPDDDQMKPNYYIQDRLMKNFFTYYPEYICFDILCEIPELDKLLVLFIGLDTNGHCEIISLGLINPGNKQSFVWLCETFKKHNPYWEKIEFILSDQGCDRDIIDKAFPDKLIFISFFHCMKTFKKDLSSLDPIVTNQDINKTLQLFEKMMFVTSESGYTELLKQMKQMHSQIFSLFKKNWHLKRELWALGLFTDSKIFLKAFNTYLLGMRRKIKPIISSQETFENVIKKLHSGILKLRKEWFQKFTSLLHFPSAAYLKVRVIEKFSKQLTPFALELVNEQLNKSENMKNVQKIDQLIYKVNGIETSCNTCFCSFHTLMMLPCCHIFAIRKFLSLPLFVDPLRSSWTSAKYLNTFYNLYVIYAMDQYDNLKAVEISGRFKECIQTSHELWKLIFNCSEDASQERLEIFQTILKAWKSSFKLVVKVSEKQTDSCGCEAEAMEDLSTDHFKEIYGLSLNDILDSENDFTDVSLCSEDAIELL